MRPAQHPLEGAKHTGLVVHHQNAGGLHDSRSWCRADAMGIVTSTRVPLPGSLSMARVPPASHTIDRQIVSPRPLPFGLVVKKGSSTRWRFSPAIPHPVSAIVMVTAP